MSVSLAHAFVKYGYRHHRGSLEDSLKTKVYISSKTFEEMLRTGNYHLYAFDYRCNQVLWLYKTGETWLFIEYVNE